VVASLSSRTEQRQDKVPFRHPEEGAPQPAFVGFADDKMLVGHPVMAPFEDEKPLKKLSDSPPCGYVAAHVITVTVSSV
jgi:hypothetical protein